MADLVLYEQGSGGEIILNENDLEISEDLFNTVYLALFGGNIEAVTPDIIVANEQRRDWWGNGLLFQDIPEIQFNSTFERKLQEVALNSAGRIALEEAAKDDLSFLEDGFAKIDVEVLITAIDRMELNVTLTQPNNIEDKILQFIWDKTKETVIINFPAGRGQKEF